MIRRSTSSRPRPGRCCRSRWPSRKWRRCWSAPPWPRSIRRRRRPLCAIRQFWNCCTRAGCAFQRLRGWAPAISRSMRVACWCAARATRNGLFRWGARRCRRSRLSAPGTTASRAHQHQAEDESGAPGCDAPVSVIARNAADAAMGLAPGQDGKQGCEPPQAATQLRHAHGGAWRGSASACR